MNKIIPVFILLFFILTACGSISSTETNPFLLEEHNLAGKIWDVKGKHFIERGELLEKIRQNEFILMGETHDNSLHHEYESWVINNIDTSGFTAYVAMEMVSDDQWDLIKGKEYNNSKSLIDDLDQVKNTWKYNPRYEPVFNTILHAGYAILPANLDRKSIMNIARKGRKNVPLKIQSYLDRNSLSDEQKKGLEREIEMSHCGMGNPHMIKAMMLTQTVKDAVMADSLFRITNVNKRILVSGSGHTRNDRGVPMYIRGEKGDARILTLAWLEVIDDLTEVSQYADRWGGKSLPFDYAWFTPRVDRPDPCASFRQHIKMTKPAQNNSMINNKN